MNDRKPRFRTDSTGAVRQQRVAVWVDLSNKKCLEKLMGLERSNQVKDGLLFRRWPTPGLTKFRQFVPPAFLRFSAMLSHLYILLVSALACLYYRPDVCVGVSFRPHGFLAKIARVFAASPAAIWYIGTDLYFHLEKPFWRKVRGPLIGYDTVAICQGSISKTKLRDMGFRDDRIIIGRNAYELSSYRPIRTEKTWDLIYTGRLEFLAKRLDVLLEAVALARRQHPNVRCAFVGTGPDASVLAAMARDLGIEGNVDFLGHRDDIPFVLNRSKIFIMTSDWEGLPSSLIEALACGVPSIVPAVGDIPFVVRHMEDAFLIETGEPAEYAAAIDRVLSDPDLYAHLAREAARTGKAFREESLSVSVGAWEDVLRLVHEG